jgi:hypothetical protein
VGRQQTLTEAAATVKKKSLRPRTRPSPSATKHSGSEWDSPSGGKSVAPGVLKHDETRHVRSEGRPAEVSRSAHNGDVRFFAMLDVTWVVAIDSRSPRWVHAYDVILGRVPHPLNTDPEVRRDLSWRTAAEAPRCQHCLEIVGQYRQTMVDLRRQSGPD